MLQFFVQVQHDMKKDRSTRAILLNSTICIKCLVRLTPQEGGDFHPITFLLGRRVGIGGFRA